MLWTIVLLYNQNAKRSGCDTLTYQVTMMLTSNPHIDTWSRITQTNNEGSYHRMFPERFLPAISKVKDLQKHDQYRGAFIFGSVARGDTTEDSDLDVKVLIDRDALCPNLSHPILNGIKLDLAFAP